MSDLKKVFKIIEGYRDEIISLQEDLTSKIALGPENGGEGEHEKAEYLKQRLKELHPDRIEEVNAPDQRIREGNRPNLIALWEGKADSPTVWVLSHMDVVPPGDLSLWDSDPYRVKVEGDRIIGRGVEDNQHGLVSSFLGLRGILEAGVSLNRNVGLVFVADEETGSEFGLGYILKTRKALFHPDDLIIVPDAGNEEGTMIEVAEKSLLHLKFTVLGRQCHASTPHKGKNSMFGSARLIVELEQIKEKYNLEDELFSPSISTFEPTRIEENVPNINTIPGRNVFYYDCRILPHYKVSEIISEMRAISDKVSEELTLKIEIEQDYRIDAPEPTPATSRVVQELILALKTVKGLEGKPMGIGGGTVAALFRQEGRHAAVWSTACDSAHQPNEYSLISNTISDAKVFASLYLGEFDA